MCLAVVLERRKEGVALAQVIALLHSPKACPSLVCFLAVPLLERHDGSSSVLLVFFCASLHSRSTALQATFITFVPSPAATSVPIESARLALASALTHDHSSMANQPADLGCYIAYSVLSCTVLLLYYAVFLLYCSDWYSLSRTFKGNLRCDRMTRVDLDGQLVDLLSFRLLSVPTSL